MKEQRALGRSKLIVEVPCRCCRDELLTGQDAE